MTDPAPAAPAATAARKPNKFMADLTKAMQTAAESARADSIERLTADAKAHIEAIHADSANEATDLRKQADDDVAAVRDWSKAEIARIREETDERITHRKTALEREIEEHAAEIEARIERVQAPRRRLRGRDGRVLRAPAGRGRPDPLRRDGRVPARAAAFDGDAPAASLAAEAVAVAEPSSRPPPRRRDRGRRRRVDRRRGRRADRLGDHAGGRAGRGRRDRDPSPKSRHGRPTSRAWPSRPQRPTATTCSASAPTQPAAERRPAHVDALGLTPDFAAAEAEAASFEQPSDDGSDDESIPEIGDDTIAARLAGLVPEGGADRRVDASTSTRLIVVGLVSVASIAGFKRHLSRATGVQRSACRPAPRASSSSS